MTSCRALTCLPYIEAIVSVWNQIGRRDNKYKARIKITVHEHGLDEIRARVEERFAAIRPTFTVASTRRSVADIKTHFAAPEFRDAPLAAYDMRPMTTTRCSAAGPTPTSANTVRRATPS